MSTEIRKEAVRAQARALAQRISADHMDLAVLLEEAYRLEYWIGWGFSSFIDYVDKELDLHYRKAMYLIDVGECIRNEMVTIRRARKIGWTRMSKVARVINAVNKEEILKLAETISSRELDERLKNLRSLGLKSVGSLTYVIQRTEKQDLASRIFSALHKVLEFRQLPLQSKEDLAVETAACLKERVCEIPQQEKAS